MNKSDPITLALGAGVQEGVFPGAVLLVRLRNTILYHKAVGLASSFSSPPATQVNTLYDLASLTKPLATASAFVCLVQDDVVHLDQTVGSVLRPLINHPIGDATIRDLLCHRSGLPAWRPFYQQFDLQNGLFPQTVLAGERRDLILDNIRHEPLEYQPRSQTLYSDLGFMLLGFVIEDKTNQSLSQFCQEGDYVDAQSGETFDCVNPANGQVLTAIASCEAADVDRAVAAARRAFDDGRWSDLPPVVRKKKLLRFAELIHQHKDELALLETLDMGKPIGDSLAIDIPAAAKCIAWYAETADKTYDEIAPTGPSALGLITREPAFFVLNTILGLRNDLREALQAVLAGQAGLSIALASLGPFTRFIYFSSADYRLAQLFNAGMFTLATVAGQILMIRYYRVLFRRNRNHRIAFCAWLILYAFVGIQMGSTSVWRAH